MHNANNAQWLLCKRWFLVVLMNGHQYILSLQQSYQLDFQPQFSSDRQRDLVKTESEKHSHGLATEPI